MALSPVMVELRASIGEFRSRMAEARGEVAKLETESRTHMAKFQAFGKAAALGVAAGVVVIGVESVKMAGEFQTATSVLQTAAGESSAGLKIVRAGILDIAKSTGTTWQNLAEGMYQVEKAGYRGADGLKILKAAAQGAKEENASLSVVTNAMTSVMASYNIPADKAVQVMNALKTAAAGSKDTMQNYAASLSTVLPIASAAHISFAQLGGALAALTRHGTTAHEATQELNGAIRGLLTPLPAAQKAMAQLGISSIEVSQKLGQRGITGSMEYLTKVIAEHTKGGLVQIGMMRQSASATDDLKRMMDQMSPAAKAMAADLMNNTITVKDYRKEAGHLDPVQAAMGRQFATLALKAKGFSDEAKAGLPVQTTMEAQLRKVTGGAVGLQTALMLSGSSTAYANDMTKRISESMNNASKEVEGWHQTQGLFNTRLDRFKQTVDVLAIQIGTKLIPVLTAAMDWMGKHKTIVEAVAGVIGGVLMIAIGAWIAGMVAAAAATVMATWPILLIVAAVAGLAAGFVYAWQKSEVFRDVVIGVVDMVKMGFYKMVYEGLGMFRVWLMAWLETAGGILHGARLMLSWVPGLGDKLKHADDAFRGFKDGALSTIDKLRDGMHEKMLAATVQTAYQSALTGQALKHGIEDRLPAYLAIADKYGKTLPQVLHDARLPAKDAATIMAQAANSGFAAGQPGASAASNQMGSSLVDGVQAHVGLAAQAGQNLALGARNGVAGVGGFDTLGSNAGQGFVNGLQSMMQPVSDAAFNMAKIATDAVAAAHNTHSPSQVFHELGRNAGLGLALGMRSTRRGVAEAALDIAQAARDAIADAHEHHGPRAHHPRQHAGAGHTGHHPHAPHIPRVTHHPRPTGLPAGRACIPVCKPGQGGSPGAQSATIDLHVILDGREIHRSVQTHELQYQARNSHSSTAVSKGSSRAC